MSDIALLQEEFQEYSRKRRYCDCDWKTPCPLWAEMDRRAQVLPGASAVELKAIQYEVIAERFVPHLFRHTPFFFEMGLKPAEAGEWRITGSRHHGLHIGTQELSGSASLLK